MRARFLLAGLALMTLLWVLPLDDWLAPFAAHMLRHMGLVALVAPLLVLGLPRVAAALALPPALAAAIEFLVVWGWHMPLSHALGQGGLAGFAFEQGSFLAAGLVVWAGCLAAAQPLAGALGLLLTSMHMTLLGALLVLAPRDLFADLCGRAPNLTGQQLGGMLMLAIGGPVYLLAGLALTARGLARRPGERSAT